MRHHTLNHIHHYKIVQRNEYSKTEECGERYKYKDQKPSRIQDVGKKEKHKNQE